MPRILALLLVLILGGCFRLGKNSTLSGESFTPEHLRKLSRQTGVHFPAGARGLEYYYHGDALDPSFYAKIDIPLGTKDEVLVNEVFRKGRNEGSRTADAAVKTWWHPEKLQAAIHRIQELDHAGYLVCHLGEENGQLVLYLESGSPP